MPPENEAGAASIPAAPEIDPKANDYPLATDFTHVEAGREEPGAMDCEIDADLNECNDLATKDQEAIN